MNSLTGLFKTFSEEGFHGWVATEKVISKDNVQDIFVHGVFCKTLFLWHRMKQGDESACKAIRTPGPNVKRALSLQSEVAFNGLR